MIFTNSSDLVVKLAVSDGIVAPLSLSRISALQTCPAVPDGSRQTLARVNANILTKKPAKQAGS
jgi:hypothetical protein